MRDRHTGDQRQDGTRTLTLLAHLTSTTQTRRERIMKQLTVMRGGEGRLDRVDLAATLGIRYDGSQCDALIAVDDAVRAAQRVESLAEEPNDVDATLEAEVGLPSMVFTDGSPTLNWDDLDSITGQRLVPLADERDDATPTNDVSDWQMQCERTPDPTDPYPH